LITKVLLISAIMLYILSLSVLVNVYISLNQELVPFITSISDIGINVKNINQIAIINENVSIDADMIISFSNPKGMNIPGPTVELRSDDKVLGSIDADSLYGNYTLHILFSGDLHDLNKDLFIMIYEKLSSGSIKIVSPINKSFLALFSEILLSISYEALKTNIYIDNSTLEIMLSLKSNILQIDTQVTVNALEYDGKVTASNITWLKLKSSGDTQKILLVINPRDLVRVSRINICLAKHPDIIIGLILLKIG